MKKQLMAILAAGAVCMGALCLTACGGGEEAPAEPAVSYAEVNDNLNHGTGAWVVRAENAEINEGVYRLALFDTYYSAKNYVPDSSKPVLDQEINGKSAAEWIKQNALENYLIPFVVKD